MLIGIGRDEADRDTPVRHPELTLELEAIHTRQTHIEQQARCLGCVLRLQESFRRRKTLHTKSHGFEQIIKRISQRGVIVDHHYEWHSAHPVPPLLTDGAAGTPPVSPERTCSSVTDTVSPAGSERLSSFGQGGYDFGGRRDRKSTRLNSSHLGI